MAGNSDNGREKRKHVTEIRDRHLDIAGFERCLAAGVPVEFPIEGEPRTFVFVDPDRPVIGLRIPDDGSGPETDLEHVEIRTVFRHEAQWLEILITDTGLFLDGYPLLCSIADRIQLQGMDAGTSIAETLRVLERLLARIGAMSTELELGLLGELLMLRGLIGSVGVEDAVESWLGPESEEHDFALHGADLEVKTTQSERRLHWISSLDQLDTSLGRPLWLVSVQLTRAGLGAGTTLPACVEIVRSVIGRGSAQDVFEDRLEKAGWRESQAGIVRTRWRPRSASQAFLVEAGFPRLTAKILAQAHVPMMHIPVVQYRVDLSDVRPAADPPSFLDRALTMEGLQ